MAHNDMFHDPETLEKLDFEYRQLCLLLGAQSKEAQDGKIAWPIHTPPALQRFCMEFAESFLDTVRSEGGDPTKTLVECLSMYGESMFRLGQYCMRNGLLYDNLTTCNCATVTDEVLADLLSEGGA